MNDLKNYVEKFVELEAEEEKYKEIINNIKKEKEKLNIHIATFMEKNNITDKDIFFGENKIKYTQTKIQENITKKLILERLKVFLKNEAHALDATNFIYNDRNSSFKTQIKCLKK